METRVDVLKARSDGDYSAERFAYTDTLVNRPHQGAVPGSFCPELPSAQEQFDACCEVMERVRRGELAPTDAFPELAWILGDGEASPSPLNLHDVLRRWPDGSMETRRLIYQWGRTAAPQPLRPCRDYDRATITKAAELVRTA